MIAEVLRGARAATRTRRLPPWMADDALQAAALDALETGGASRAWGGRTVRWHCATEMRRRDRHARAEAALVHHAGAVATPADLLAEAEVRRLIREAASMLDADELALLLDERPLREMAAERGIDTSTAWRRREKARARLLEAAREVGL